MVNNISLVLQGLSIDVTENQNKNFKDFAENIFWLINYQISFVCHRKFLEHSDLSPADTFPSSLSLPQRVPPLSKFHVCLGLSEEEEEEEEEVEEEEEEEGEEEEKEKKVGFENGRPFDDVPKIHRFESTLWCAGVKSLYSKSTRASLLMGSLKVQSHA